MSRVLATALLGSIACASADGGRICAPDALRARLEEAPSPQRIASIRSFARCGGEQRGDVLLEVASDPGQRWWVREVAIRELGAEPAVLPGVARLAAAPGLELELRFALVDALERLAPAAEACFALEHLAGLGDSLLGARALEAASGARCGCQEEGEC